MKTNKTSTVYTIFSIWMLLLCAGCNNGTAYIFNSSTERPVPVSLKESLPYQPIWLCTGDLVTLHGWYISGQPEQPLVIFFHGNAANITHRWENLLDLHRQGYSVLIFDYRGFGRSDGAARNEQDLLVDARAALRYAKRKGWKQDEIIYYGRSMGASVALSLALESVPAGLILEAPFTTLRKEAMFHSPLIFHLVGWWVLPDEFNNLEKISHLRCPLLLIHGDQDKIVPFEMSQQLYDLAPQPKYFFRVPGGGHSDVYKIAGQRFHKVWSEFIQQTIAKPTFHPMTSQP